MWKLVSIPKRKMQKNRSSDQVPDTEIQTGKYPHHTIFSRSNSKRSNTPSQPPKRSVDPSRLAHGAKLKQIAYSLVERGIPSNPLRI